MTISDVDDYLLFLTDITHCAIELGQQRFFDRRLIVRAPSNKLSGHKVLIEHDR